MADMHSIALAADREHPATGRERELAVEGAWLRPFIQWLHLFSGDQRDDKRAPAVIKALETVSLSPKGAAFLVRESRGLATKWQLAKGFSLQIRARRPSVPARELSIFWIHWDLRSKC